VATYRRTIHRNPWIPDSALPRENAKQRAFLLLTDVNEVFYGGAAGGGKTYATLIAAAQFVDVPGYSALLLRENFSDLNQPGAWIPLSKSWWLNTEAEWRGGEHRWYFPSGATVTFGYLANDDAVYQYDTAAYQYIAIDELVQHSEWRYTFMFGRMRRPRLGPLSRVPTRMRSASNPGGKGHEWVYKRFIDPRTREPGAVFVPARVEDNAGNMDVEAYKRDSLSKLDPLTRRQREEGDWTAISGGRFSPDSLKKRYKLLRGKQYGEGEFDLGGRKFLYRDCRRFQICDPAASEARVGKKGKLTDPDYTVVGTFAVTPDYDLVWLDTYRERKEVPDLLGEIEGVWDQWRPDWIGVEAVGANSAVYQFLSRTHLIVKALNPAGQDKVVVATPAIILAAAGRLWFPERAHWLQDVLTELLLFKGDGKGHDDCVSCVSYAARSLDDQGPTGCGKPIALGGRGR
jgi:phage terminase large subunit-like protein